MANRDYQHTEKSCPICREVYQARIVQPAPTCGNPNCIREARERGLPFAVPPMGPVHGPEPKKKPTAKKPGKK